MSQQLGITVDKDEEPGEWYSQVVKKAGLAEHSNVKGCIIVRPWGMKLWESIKQEFDGKIKDTGVDNAYFPMFIPESFFEKENEIVEGFDPEVAWITEGGDEELDERVALRPTSELVIADKMSDWIRSHRDLPFRVNQWANVVRWEATQTRPFLRTREFLWQEGHTAHATEDAADEEVMLRLEQYQEVVEDHLNIPSILGYKPEHDKFPGAKVTTTVETLMPDGKSIQSATSHNLGQHFAGAFDITFEDADSNVRECWTTSWGLSWRTIGALVMAHGDDSGLRLPPSIAPVQAVIVPIHGGEDRGEVLDYAEEVERQLSGFRTEVDERDNRTPGYKFNEWELKGVPLRLEIGPDEVESGTVTAVRRDTGDREQLELEDVGSRAGDLLEDIQDSMYSVLEEYLEDNIREASTTDEIIDTIRENRGYVKARWCGDEECEARVKDEVAAEIVVLPFREDSEPGTIREEEIGGECAVCGEDAATWAYYAKNY